MNPGVHDITTLSTTDGDVSRIFLENISRNSNDLNKTTIFNETNQTGKANEVGDTENI